MSKTKKTETKAERSLNALNNALIERDRALAERDDARARVEMHKKDVDKAYKRISNLCEENVTYRSLIDQVRDDARVVGLRIATNKQLMAELSRRLSPETGWTVEEDDDDDE